MTQTKQNSVARMREEFEVFYAAMWSHDSGRDFTAEDVARLWEGRDYGDRPFLNALFRAWPYLSMRLKEAEARIAELEEYYESHEDQHETGILNMTPEQYDRIARARAALTRDTPIDYLSEPGPGEGSATTREGGV